MSRPDVTVIGAGLAGVEAACTLARRGVRVDLFEMRPVAMTPAHTTDLLAELVCSNSLKGTDPLTAHGILKREMAGLGSVTLDAASRTRVPAGKALAVDREAFARTVTDEVSSNRLISVIRQEVASIPLTGLTVIATGPLTSDAMVRSLASLTGSGSLYFYDAISPIVDARSVDMDHAFFSSRWDPGATDYLNCPMDEETYRRFVAELRKADRVTAHDFEDVRYFDACLPVEVLAVRGEDALRYGPLRPVGLVDPRTQRRPYAVVQLRRENLPGDAYTMVGFQTRLTYPEQRRVISLIPALAHARLLRYGSMHRNTYVDSPRVLNTDLSLMSAPDVFLAGQITGVEGYVESAAMGILAGLSVHARLKGSPFVAPPPESAIGALLHYITNRSLACFQPMNINFGIMPVTDAPRKIRAEVISERARREFGAWMEHMGKGPTPHGDEDEI